MESTRREDAEGWGRGGGGGCESGRPGWTGREGDGRRGRTVRCVCVCVCVLGGGSLKSGHTQRQGDIVSK